MERSVTERNFRIPGRQPKFRFAPFLHSFLNLFDLLSLHTLFSSLYALQDYIMITENKKHKNFNTNT